MFFLYKNILFSGMLQYCITFPYNFKGLFLPRLTLNILLSFAQFEREIISERTRDKMGAARVKGKWIGGRPPLGYIIAVTEPGPSGTQSNPVSPTKKKAPSACELPEKRLPQFGTLRDPNQTSNISTFL